ncbi:hypothetical protein P154DRAFT_596873 [Amniculicola lignicola CBS 123094]|uniref:Nuclease n=1 Tax=Amniculicola lignicola CBS 123094 TaxID=1392246 RepID=A0A6A5WUG8_9PLEO|nr:hypothetical protein P154DRAFT_596873 [Amniculicola lignicola CBS 123094]
MDYTLLRGHFVIQFVGVPVSENLQPDGDTIRFIPEDTQPIKRLPRQGKAPDFKREDSINVRMEAIDALETQVDFVKHQHMALGKHARDELLRRLGFTGTVWRDPPNSAKVRRTDNARLPGTVLSNGVDGFGRLIGFAYEGNPWPNREHGSTISVDDEILDLSVNSQLLEDGHVYPIFYGTLPAPLRESLATKSRAAREADKGLYKLAKADPEKGPFTAKPNASGIVTWKSFDKSVIWPKLFRRLALYLKDGEPDLDGFDNWLRAGSSNDKILRLDTQEEVTLADVIEVDGLSIQLTVFPEDLVIEPA